MQIGRKMTEFEAFEVVSVVLEHPVQTDEMKKGKKIAGLSHSSS